MDRLAMAQRRESEEEGARQSAHRGVIAGVRTLIERGVRLDASSDVLSRLAEGVETLANQFAAHDGGGRPRQEPVWDESDPNGVLPYSPGTGRHNPLAGAFDLFVEDRQGEPRVVGCVQLTDAYEGRDGTVHGSVIAGIYDQMLAFAVLRVRGPAPTASLTINYRRPTPICAELRFESWVERVDGRKLFARGCCLAGEDLVSEAEGLFIKQGV